MECDPTTAGYPDACDWPSIRTIKATAPIHASGDHTEWNSANQLLIQDSGKYMVTVMAEGYRLCGGYFQVEPNSHVTTTDVNMTCQKHPLPLGIIRLFVFEDSQPCNGQHDPSEKPLGDFGIVINDIEGPVTDDYYGNNLLEIVSDSETGMIEIPNMWPGRYEIYVGPSPSSGLIKTNTLEGGHRFNYWLHGTYERSKTCLLLKTITIILILAFLIFVILFNRGTG